MLENFLKLIETEKIRFVTLEKKNTELEEFIIFYEFSYYTKYLDSNTHMREIKISQNSEIIFLGNGKYRGKNLIILEKYIIEDNPIFEDEEQCIKAIKYNWIAF